MVEYTEPFPDTNWMLQYYLRAEGVLALQLAAPAGLNLSALNYAARISPRSAKRFVMRRTDEAGRRLVHDAACTNKTSPAYLEEIWRSGFRAEQTPSTVNDRRA